MFKISFLGAMGSVGCSGVLIDTESEKFVLDYGTKPREIPPKFPLPVEEKINALFLTHAHLDHSGGIPLLKNCPIFSIPVTKPLTELLLLDSIKVNREEGVELPFTREDIKKTLNSFVDVKYREKIRIGSSEIIFFDAGHVPGSAEILISSGGKNLLYTGDLKTTDTRLLKKADLDLPKINILITESTYGCVPPDTKIVLSNNKTKRIESLTNETLVKAMDRNLQLKDFKISKIWKRKYKGKMFTIITESNKKLTLTPNHPLFIKNGRNILIKPVSEVNVGEHVPVVPPKKSNIFISPSQLHIHELSPDDKIYVKLKSSFLREIILLVGKKRDEIAKLLNISKNTLDDYLKTKSYQNPRTGMKRLYFMPLFIAKKLVEIAGKSLDSLENNIEEWKSKNSLIRIKNIFPLEKNALLAKLLAKSFGDGHVRLNKGLYFEYPNTSAELLAETDGIVKKLFNITFKCYDEDKKKCKRHYYPLIGAILYTLGCPEDKVDEIMKIPEWIKNGTKEIKASFLRGLFDDEAHVSYYKTKGNRTLRKILLKMAKNKKLKNNLIEFFADLKQMLFDLDISARVDLGPEYGDRIKLILVIQGKKNIENFKNNIGFTHPLKKELLEKILEDEWEERAPRKDIAFEKILNIETFLTNGTEVYDLTIGELGDWGNFVANGIIIHNSRDHPDRKSQEEEMIRIIEDTLAQDGVCLISAFAVGRSQEVLLVLDKYGIDYPLYLDGMAKKATTIINQYQNFLKEPKSLDEALKKVQYVSSEKFRKKIIKQPCVIVTTSGLLEGGPVVSYLKRLYDKRNCSLILTGWQLEGTAGRILLETGHYIAKDLDLEVKMFVKRLDFSAHLGRSELFDFIEKINPEKIFCVHGDHTEEFASELREKGFDAIAPLANNRNFVLD
jgi:Cft2 family RNA processing exonuclease